MTKKISILSTFERSFEIASRKPLVIGAFLLLTIISLLIIILAAVSIFQDIYNLVFSRIILALILITFASWLSMVGVCGIILSVEKIYRGKKIDFSEISKQSFRNSFRVLLGYSLEELFIMLGFLLLIIPGVIIFVRLSLTVPACILEKRGLGIKRSWHATKGNFWKIFLILLIWLGVFFITSFIPFIFILSVLLSPVYLTTLTILYLQLKKRK